MQPRVLRELAKVIARPLPCLKVIPIREICFLLEKGKHHRYLQEEQEIRNGTTDQSVSFWFLRILCSKSFQKPFSSTQRTRWWWSGAISRNLSREGSFLVNHYEKDGSVDKMNLCTLTDPPRHLTMYAIVKKRQYCYEILLVRKG